MSDMTKKFGPRSSAEAYRKTDVMTANRETILLMMYAGAIRFLKAAIEASDTNNLPEKSKMIDKTQGIILELRSTLNFDVGGDIARSLELLYAFISQRLIQASSPGIVDPLKEALAILVTLNEGWEQAIANLRKEKTKTE